MNTITTDNDAIIFNGERYAKEPKYDRQACLRGEYEIPPGGTGYALLAGVIIRYSRFDEAGYQYTKRIGTKFFPTPELAEEYKLIGEGEWLPKEGDAVWLIGDNPRWWDGKAASFDYKKSGIEKYFPSAEQRDAYTAKHKPKPKLRDGLRTPEKGQKYFCIAATRVGELCWVNDTHDEQTLALGNVFLSRKNAERILEQRQIMARLHKWIDENDARPLDGRGVQVYRVTNGIYKMNGKTYGYYDLGAFTIHPDKFDAFITACKPDLDRWHEIEKELQVSLYE